ncbi:lipocalin family protein [Hymenobacter arizonensis]|uniref:Lipocalin-like domain-containing protein n=1 Tax=Hymenobacter arizonensis TaxID=1227077 RepID=A0A1I6BEU4_HYMAR|nr:lipocalin family protein [Hymenobacter arizonensis]SFQ79434.1 Lipocalin-like domain-containing protein [Hymenobacter arizonensis]
MKHVLPLLFCLSLAACGSPEGQDPAPITPPAPLTPQARLLGTWNWQTTREQRTYLSGNNPNTDITVTHQNTSVTYLADGTCTWTMIVNGQPLSNSTAYTFDGKILQIIHAAPNPPPAEVIELTANKLVTVSTETKVGGVRIETITATR